MFRTRSLKFFLAAACALALAAPASAVQITYEIQNGTDGGLGFSLLHDSDDNSPMSGASLGRLHGTLVFDYDMGLDEYTLLDSMVALDNATYDFAFTGGTLSGDGGGSLDFSLSGAGPFAQVSSFLFQGGPPICCGAGGPNFLTPEKIRLWGMSDIGISATTGGPKRLGIDLGAAPVPEPSAAVVFGLGLVVVGAGMRQARTGDLRTQ